MSSSNCCFLTCIQVSQESGQVLWYSHLFQNCPQFIAIHTVKGFGIVNKAEIDVFLELSKILISINICFSIIFRIMSTEIYLLSKESYPGQVSKTISFILVLRDFISKSLSTLHCISFSFCLLVKNITHLKIAVVLLFILLALFHSTYYEVY